MGDFALYEQKLFYTEQLVWFVPADLNKERRRKDKHRKLVCQVSLLSKTAPLPGDICIEFDRVAVNKFRTTWYT